MKIEKITLLDPKNFIETKGETIDRSLRSFNMEKCAECEIVTNRWQPISAIKKAKDGTYYGMISSGWAKGNIYHGVIVRANITIG